jgi:hypothetical protein
VQTAQKSNDEFRYSHEATRKKMKELRLTTAASKVVSK